MKPNWPKGRVRASLSFIVARGGLKRFFNAPRKSNEGALSPTIRRIDCVGANLQVRNQNDTSGLNKTRGLGSVRLLMFHWELAA
jgi:hypothetical protein